MGVAYEQTQLGEMIHQLNSSINSSLHAYTSLIEEEEKQDTVKTHCRVECRQIPSTELRRDLLVKNNNKYFEKFLKVFGEHLNMSVCPHYSERYNKMALALKWQG